MKEKGKRDEEEEGTDKEKDDEVSGWAFDGEDNSFLLAFIIALLSSGKQTVGLWLRVQSVHIHCYASSAICSEMK